MDERRARGDEMFAAGWRFAPAIGFRSRGADRDG
jgi:hypothetical protein